MVKGASHHVLAPLLSWGVALLLHTHIQATLQRNVEAHDTSGDFQTYSGYRLLETHNLTNEQARILATVGANWDFWKAPRESSGAVIFAPPEDRTFVEEALRRAGICFNEQSWNTPRRHVQGRSRRSLRAISFTSFHRLDDILQYLDNIAKQFPELATVINIGSSLEGRALNVIRISSDKGRTGKPAAFIDAGIHAREWIAPSTALYTIFQLVENYTANREYVEGLDWYILPVLNPDGYEYTFTNERFWRKTRSFNGKPDCLGVDANRNFGFHWGEVGTSGDPCSQIYRGPSKFSEVEARIVADFMATIPNLNLYLTLHSFGNLLLYPWGYTRNLPDDVGDLHEAASAATLALEAVRGTKYKIGSSANIYYQSSGTSRDWAKGELGVKYVYTMELPRGGSGFDPPPEDIIPVVTETFEAIKVLGNRASLCDQRVLSSTPSSGAKFDFISRTYHYLWALFGTIGWLNLFQ